MEDPVDFGRWKISCVNQNFDFGGGMQKTNKAHSSFASVSPDLAMAKVTPKKATPNYPPKYLSIPLYLGVKWKITIFQMGHLINLSTYKN